MNSKKTLGAQGELAVKNWLIEKKYQIIGSNIRIGHHEIDLLAKKDGLLIFFEIKTGHYLPDDFPLKKRQLQSLKIARIKYCQIHQISLETTRLDLVIIIPAKEGAKLEWLTNISP